MTASPNQPSDVVGETLPAQLVSTPQAVHRCDFCGRFFSDRTRDNHRACFMILNERDSGYRG